MPAPYQRVGHGVPSLGRCPALETQEAHAVICIAVGEQSLFPKMKFRIVLREKRLNCSRF